MKKKMKWNWGSGIAMVYTVFALSIIALVVHSFRQKIDLVAPDYYSKELAYQQQIDKMQRARELEKAIVWTVSLNQIELNVPESFEPSRVSGNITLFKPSNDKSDKVFDIKIGENHSQIISTEGLESGMYKLKIDWKSGDSTYYQEGVIMINA
ncbi:MAG: FixH family protein [Bacteroidia bacterium]